MRLHNFKKSLQFSHNAEDLPIWEEIYRNAFPDFMCMISHRQDGPHQRQGIDRSVILSNSKQILVDEKVRAKDYGDILLEVWSDKHKRVPGWVAKDLLCDFIAYAILPSGKCYLLPVQQLRMVWRKNGRRWWESCFIAEAHNDGWITQSVAVSAEELLNEIKQAFVVDFCYDPAND